MKIPSLDVQTVQMCNIATELVGDIRNLIHESKVGLAATVNSTLTLLYWRIGRRIHT